MKIAITTSGDGWDAAVDARFGRARAFAIVTEGEDALTLVPNNQNLQAAQGAGIQAAQTVADQGVRVLLTGHVGPKAFRALSAAGIDIYSGVQGSVRDAFNAYKSGTLEKATGADVRGHW